MKKILLTFLLLINCFLGFSQNEFKIVSQKVISDYDDMRIVNAEIIKENLILSCRTEKNGYNYPWPELLILKNNQIQNDYFLDTKEQVFFSEIKYLEKGILLVGEISTDTDEEMQDYLGYFNLNNKLIWELKLEKKYEGFRNVFYSIDYFEVITDGINGFFKYKIDYNGKIIEKKSISINNYIHAAIKLSNSNFIVLSDTLNSNGQSITYEISLLDKDLKVLNSNKFKPVNSYLPNKILEYENGFLIAGNIDSDSLIPYLYFLNKDLKITKSLSYHFEPEYYKFKSDFHIKDIKYLQSSKTFIASGIAKEGNVIFSLNEEKLLRFKILDSSGRWGNNKLLITSENSVLFLGNVIKNDDFDRSIKIINIEL